MTKAELIDAVSQKAGVSKADAERTISEFFDLVVSSAMKGDKVAWPGFGSFSTSKRK
ncbi:MAG: HU family DNA-binding protein, partial [Actinobacteria bacterium]|nr:HU family DNA-binding protein [Actinomycetota bacterium]